MSATESNAQNQSRLTSRSASILLGTLALIAVSLSCNRYLYGVAVASRNKADTEWVQPDEWDSSELLNMTMKSLIKMNISLSDEVQRLKMQRQTAQDEVAKLSREVAKAKVMLHRGSLELDQLQQSLKELYLSGQEQASRNVPLLRSPVPLPSKESQALLSPVVPYNACRMRSCFDYSRCPIASGFAVYVYSPDDSHTNSPTERAVLECLSNSVQATLSPETACIFIAVVTGRLQGDDVRTHLRGLRFWGSNGLNHIVISLTQQGSHELRSVEAGRAILAQTTFLASEFRPNFDIISPAVRDLEDNTTAPEPWTRVWPLLPARRRFLLSFQGQLSAKQNDVTHANDAIQTALGRMMLNDTFDYFLFELTCNSMGGGSEGTGDWSLCGTEELRRSLLLNSTFALIVAPPSSHVVTASFLTRLHESLESGAIPVILGADQVALPFSEFIDWSRVVLFLPAARVVELHFVLRAYGDSDVVELRLRGRLVWEHYLSTPQRVAVSLLSLIRARLGIPAHAVNEESTPGFHSVTFHPPKADGPVPDAWNEGLCGAEPPFPVPTYQRNFSVTLNEQSKTWNERFDPHILYPFRPDDPLLPSDAKFKGSSFGFRPIGEGAGGSGREFRRSLGGNLPKEQFTVIILTYDREAMLMDTLQHLRGLPYLNKILVIWNRARAPSPDLRWPDIGVPVQVIRSKKNSLNNRFLPYSLIETEAVFTLDDDIYITQQSMVFAFRVWREARDRIVGFPERYHEWNSAARRWRYSAWNCEISMVLTGAALFHKYYSYVYTYKMPQAIRELVDNYMNCEDIAFNFLVAHMTRKPPIKVAPGAEFVLRGSRKALAGSRDHYDERTACLNFFTRVYGYTPLLYTQVRLDTMLYGVPALRSEERCFRNSP